MTYEPPTFPMPTFDDPEPLAERSSSPTAKPINVSPVQHGISLNLPNNLLLVIAVFLFVAGLIVLGAERLQEFFDNFKPLIGGALVGAGLRIGMIAVAKNLDRRDAILNEEDPIEEPLAPDYREFVRAQKEMWDSRRERADFATKAADSE